VDDSGGKAERTINVVYGTETPRHVLSSKRRKYNYSVERNLQSFERSINFIYTMHDKYKKNKYK